MKRKRKEDGRSRKERKKQITPEISRCGGITLPAHRPRSTTSEMIDEFETYAKRLKKIDRNERRKEIKS